MTEPMGRGARWGTVALVAPLAAAALAAATGWGVAHPPAASGKGSSSGQAAGVSSGQPLVTGVETAGLDKSLLALQTQASNEQARVVRLQNMLNRLHARTRALARAPLPGSGGSSTTRSVSGSSSAGGVAVAAPPRVAAAPAPATHTSTGASGAVR